MTSQTGKKRFGWRRAVTGAAASSALAVGLMIGFGPATAHADVLDDIGAKYMQGAGGGQVSNFAKEALTLRTLGFRPSKANLEALQAGWDYLPNQTRLVDALKETVVYQRKIQAQKDMMQQAQQKQNPLLGAAQEGPGQSPVGGNLGPILFPGTGNPPPITP
jgi:hypothetical protein